jgi:hypothetical protein
MEYNADGTMKLKERAKYPLTMYKKGGEMVVARNEEEESVLRAAGASHKVHDREVHK